MGQCTETITATSPYHGDTPITYKVTTPCHKPRVFKPTHSVPPASSFVLFVVFCLWFYRQWLKGRKSLTRKRRYRHWHD